MKKNRLYAALMILFITAAGFIIIKFRGDENKNQPANYQLLQRTGPMAQSEEWKKTQTNVARLQQAIKVNPKDKKSLIALANLFVLEARATGNYTYYDKVAMKCVDDVLALEKNDFEALTLKALIYLSQHHFADGLSLAQQAQRSNPYNSFLYGVLVDGYVEMGHYDSAIVSADRMMELRPDIRSYSRASYIREIYGDYDGAIQGMKMAIDAGVPGDESTEWARVQLGHLYEMTGDLRSAEMHYTISLQNRPGYAYALAGLGGIAMGAKNYDKALAYYSEADSLANNNTFKEEMIDAYLLNGDKQKATDLSKLAIDDMNKNAQSAVTDQSLGHYADRELAYAYLKINDNEKALEHALAEYNRRPDNIDVNETVAWVYYKKGDHAKAIPYIDTALKTNSQNPVLLCRAGLIYQKAGNNAKAKEYLQNGLKNNANIPEELKNEASATLKQLQSAKA